MKESKYIFLYKFIMKKASIFSAVFYLGVLGIFAQEQKHFILEAEDFFYQNNWGVSNKDGQSLLAVESANDKAMTMIEVKKEGLYDIWVSSYDFEKINPRSRNFKVFVNDVELTNMGGMHGKDGWAWEKLGVVQLNEGFNKIEIQRVGMYPRVDAFLFSLDGAFTPDKTNLYSSAERKKIQISSLSNLKLKFSSTEFEKLSKLSKIPDAKKVSIQNKFSKISFTQVADSKGKIYFERSIDVFVMGKWVEVPSFKDEILFIGYESKKPNYQDTLYFPTWKFENPTGYIITSYKGKNLHLPPENTYPYGTKKMSPQRIVGVEKVSNSKLKLTYECGATALLYYEMQTSVAARFDISYKAPEDGYYTVGMLGFNAVEKTDVNALLMPPLFQMRSQMTTPKLLGNRFTSQPLSLLQINIDKDYPISYALVANPENLPSEEWSKKGCSIYGFSHANPFNKAQVAIFQPIMGGINSEKILGEEIKSSWYIFTIAGKWHEALESINEEILAGGKIFREPYATSLSDATANIAVYLKNQDASGWSAKSKARWNIEDKDLVTTASPLAEVSVAMLTDDEEYYENISLPTIEYTLSRRSAHFKASGEKSPYSPTPAALNVPSLMWKADYFAGLKTLLGGANTWVDDILKDTSKQNFYSAMPEWVSMFGIYLAQPDAELLEKVKKSCDDWLVKAFMHGPFEENNFEAFANVSYYPYWWYLPDLYEVTKNDKYLQYAIRGAYHTVAALWAYPTPKSGEVLINKDNKVRGVGHIWWKGSEKFRLGASPADLERFSKNFSDTFFIIDTKKVDALKVSRIGLGIEQPSTFRALYGGHDSNILMPSWSAELLKTYQYSKQDVLKKYSRHAIIGRYANFLGYYICDFTDIQHDENYPYKGPDITSFYYHHAPCHFAQSYDYLMTQFEVATDGKIKFPFVRQQGYVWFTDRIFGGLGKIFDDEKCRLIIDKSAVRPDTPKVSVLSAYSKSFVWVILLNDSAKDLETNVVLNPDSKLLKDALLDKPIAQYNANGELLQSLNKDSLKLKIPAQSVIALKIDANKSDPFPKLPKLPKDSHIVKKNALEGFGDLHIFRIRSPFGKDSIYVMLTEGLKKNAKLNIDIAEPFVRSLSAESFPFEISTYPIDMKKNISLSVSIEEEGKAPQQLGTFILKAAEE